MIQHSPISLRLVLPAIGWLAVTGCQTDRDWPGVMQRNEPAVVTGRDSHFARRDAAPPDAPSVHNGQPQHSTRQDEYYQHDVPFVEQQNSADTPTAAPAPALPRERRSFDRLFPPLVPPSRPETEPSDADQSKEDALLPASERLIKALRSPRFFFPGQGRSIYDRLRGPDTEADAEQVVPQPHGPIAQLPFREKAARVCQYREVEQAAANPVTLGLPEPVHGPESDPHGALREGIADRDAPRPENMQATPSSFRHPLLADPTGVPYRPLSDY